MIDKDTKSRTPYIILVVAQTCPCSGSLDSIRRLPVLPVRLLHVMWRFVFILDGLDGARRRLGGSYRNRIVYIIRPVRLFRLLHVTW
jgi:hypothetical protein